jgi:peptidyl-prolyl cis-trans isomerase B (cyclophilin B)
MPVPTNVQRRQQAKRKLERQLVRRAERAKKRRIIIALSVVGAIVVAGGGFLLIKNLTAPAQAAAPGPCQYKASVTEPAPNGKDVGLPPDPDPTPTDGTQKATFTTNAGDIAVLLDRQKAPCTTQSFLHLASHGFFDNTSCHRLTASDGLKVLQCGDPTGTGSGGPGYSIPDELPRDLKVVSAPGGGAAGSAVEYQRGLIAMANAGPSTGGSQFFLVYGNSTLPPNYTVFGTIDPNGLSVIDKVAAAGLPAGADPSQGAKPNLAVTISGVTLA